MLIAISGRSNSGKDTVAGIIQDLTSALPWMEHPFQIHKFADALKDCTCRILGCTREQLEDREYKEKELGVEWKCWKVKESSEANWKLLPCEAGVSLSDFWDAELVCMTPRLLMQLLGTDCGRQILHPNLWVNSTFANYKPSDSWILTDCRFPNELEAVKARGGVVIRIERGKLDLNVHESESALDNYNDFDYVIYNDGSIDDLVEKVKAMLNEMKITK